MMMKLEILENLKFMDREAYARMSRRFDDLDKNEMRKTFSSLLCADDMCYRATEKKQSNANWPSL